MRREDPIDVRYEIVSQDAGPEAVLHDTDPEFADDMGAAEETAVSPYDMSSVLSRSNILILTKYKATNIESKLLLMTLYEAQKSAGTMPIQFSTQQLLSAMKLNKSSYIYDQIKIASVGISKTQFCVRIWLMPENDAFAARMGVTTASTHAAAPAMQSVRSCRRRKGNVPGTLSEPVRFL